MKPSSITTLFLDIGGVILSNGWDHTLREKAAQAFQLDLIELNKRHALIFDTFEIGKITLDAYLERVVFYQPRPFTLSDFKEFMFDESHPFPDMIDLIKEIKSRYSLQVVALSNEGRELMENRRKKFHLKEMIDFFVCSGFVGLRKPDLDIYKLALELSQSQPSEVIYLDDRPLLAEIGQSIGLHAIQHKTCAETKKTLNEILSPRTVT